MWVSRGRFPLMRWPQSRSRKVGEEAVWGLSPPSCAFKRGSELVDNICQAALFLHQLCEASRGWQVSERAEQDQGMGWMTWWASIEVSPLSTRGKGSVWSESVLCPKTGFWTKAERIPRHTHTHHLWNTKHFVEEGIYTQSTISTTAHKGLGNREMQGAPFQQGVSWETISSRLGKRHKDSITCCVAERKILFAHHHNH